MFDKKFDVKNEKGFTLIEMLLVVVILSTLAAMIVPRFAGRSDEARAAAARADVQANLASALDLYEIDNGAYPNRLEDLVTDPGTARRWRGPYVKKKARLTDPWGRDYVYAVPSSKGLDYDLMSSGPDGRAGNDDDITNDEDRAVSGPADSR